MGIFLGRSARARGLVTASLCAVLLGATLNPSAQAGQMTGPINCPEVMPVASIQKGTLGTGWTVAEGSTPESFNVEVLGILEDGIAPGRDMIVVEVNGPLIAENGGGIWQGMSGSPVYVNDKLIGAVAYGLTWGPSNVGGLTAAEDMYKVFGYPADPNAESERDLVRATPAVQRSIAAESGESSSGEFERLDTPLAMGGMSSRTRQTFEAMIEREGLALRPYGAASGDGSDGTGAAPVNAGQNFAGVISQGDVTLGGIGTATARCGDEIIAFGHPFFWEGRTDLGAARATAITVVSDPVAPAFKLANIRRIFGTVDQDRLAAIGANLLDQPELIPVHSVLTSSTSTGDTREGTTSAVSSRWLPTVAFAHLLSNADVVFDRIGEGHSSMSWTITGTTGDGTPWTLTRSNRFSSAYDITYESLSELQSQLYTLFDNRFDDDIEFTGVDVSGAIEEEQERFRLQRILVAKNGNQARAVRKVIVKGGDRLRVTAVLKDMEENVQTVAVTMRVPDDFRRRGSISVSGGNGGDYYFECFYDTDECYGSGGGGSKVSSFEELVESLESKPKNSDLTFTLRTGRRMKVKAKIVRSLNQVVVGSRSVRLATKNGDRDPDGVSEPPKY